MLVSVRQRLPGVEQAELATLRRTRDVPTTREERAARTDRVRFGHVNKTYPKPYLPFWAILWQNFYLFFAGYEKIFFSRHLFASMRARLRKSAQATRSVFMLLAICLHQTDRLSAAEVAGGLARRTHIAYSLA